MAVDRRLKLAAQLTAAGLRRQLVRSVRPGDRLVIQPHPLSFTQTRALLTVINTVAWDRGATLRYADEPAAYPPPLLPRYSHPPHITTPRKRT